MNTGYPLLGVSGVDIPYPFTVPVTIFDDFTTWHPMKFLASAAGVGSGSEYYSLSPSGGTIAVAAGVWDGTALTVTATLTGYVFAAGDMLVLTSGTGVTAGNTYPIVNGDATFIQMSDDINGASGDVSDIVGTIKRGDQVLTGVQGGLGRNGEWMVLGVNAATTSVTPQLGNTINGGGGFVRLTPASADGDETIILHWTAPVNWFTPTATIIDGQPWSFQSRAIISSITTSRQAFGVGPISGGTNPMDSLVAGSLANGSALFYIENGAVFYAYKTSASAAAVKTPAIYQDTKQPVRVVAGGVYTFSITFDGVAGLNFAIASDSNRVMRSVAQVGVVHSISTMTCFAGTGNFGGTNQATMDVDYMALVGSGPKGGR